jgi:hypothetical protein
MQATPRGPQQPGMPVMPPPGFQPHPQAQPKPQLKILRIGIIQGGRIVEERLVRERVSVTVGQSAKNMFVVPSEALPRSFVMFEVTPQGYALNFTGQMDGRISLGDAVVPLVQLQGRAAPRPGGVFQLPLTDKARGKIIAGDMTLLFQFVTPPPRQPRPQLPPSVRGGFGTQVDGMMAGVLGGSFVLHLAFALYMVFFVEIPKNIDIDEEFRQFQKVFTVKVQPPETKKAAGLGDTGKADKSADAGKADKKRGPKGPVKQLSAEERAKIAAARAAERVARARGEAAKVGILAVLTSKGGSGDSAFGDALAGGGAQSDIDRAMKGMGGVTTAGGGRGSGLASVGGGGGAGGKITSISDLGKASAGPVGGGGGSTGTRTERKIKISGGAVRDVESGELDISGANATIKRGYASIKACYDRGLKRNPKLGGKLSVKITVNGAGGVGNVSVTDDTLSDPDVVNCMRASIRGWRFPPAQGGKNAAVEPTWVFKTAD